MKLFLILQICQLLQIACGQVKNCYDWNGVVRIDYPCDPSANVSTVVLSPLKPMINALYNESRSVPAVELEAGVPRTCFALADEMIRSWGTCTDSSWVDDACPFVLSLFPGSVAHPFWY